MLNILPEDQVTGLEKKLIQVLRNMWNDEEFILGSRLYLDNDEDRQTMIEAIETGEVDNPSDVVLYSLQLYEERREDFYICPCCGEKGFEEIGVGGECCYCGWKEDRYQEAYPDREGGANHMSLNEARAAYEAGEPIH